MKWASKETYIYVYKHETDVICLEASEWCEWTLQGLSWKLSQPTAELLSEHLLYAANLGAKYLGFD